MEIITYVLLCFVFIDKGRPAYCKHSESTQERTLRDLAQWLRRHAASAGGLSLIPGQGARSHMPQLKIPRAGTKIQAARLINFLKIITKIIYLLLAALGLCCCAWACSSYGEWELLSSCGAQTSHQSGFSRCRARALDSQASVLLRVAPLALRHVGFIITKIIFFKKSVHWD